MKSVLTIPASFALPLIITITGIVLCLFLIVSKNLLAKDVVFSFAALSAAFLMFYLNISLGMKPQQHSLTVHTLVEITPNKTIEYEPYRLLNKSSFVVFNRYKVSGYLSNLIDSYIKDEMISLKSDEDFEKREEDADQYEWLMLNWVIGDLLFTMPDWKETKTTFYGSERKSFVARKSDSSADQFLSIEEIDDSLNRGRAFSLRLANTGLVEGLNLPPKTKANFKNNKVTFSNSFYKLTIRTHADINHEIKTYMVDENGKHILDEHGNKLSLKVIDETSILTKPVNIYIETIFKRDRIGSPELDIYKNWLSNINNHIQKTFSAKAVNQTISFD